MTNLEARDLTPASAAKSAAAFQGCPSMIRRSSSSSTFSIAAVYCCSAIPI